MGDNIILKFRLRIWTCQMPVDIQKVKEKGRQLKVIFNLRDSRFKNKGKIIKIFKYICQKKSNLQTI